jgi:excisionase family DNA binding protein
MGKVLTVREIAERLKVCDETVYRMIREKELKAVKIRGNIRVKEEELEALLAVNDD